MPFVKEYQPDAGVPGPFETRQARDMDTGNVGGALSRLGNTISDVGELAHRRDAMNEISDVGAKLSAAHADLTSDLRDSLQGAAPDDSSVTEKFMQGYDERMGDIGNNISTPEARRYFQRANAQMRASLLTTAMAKQSQMAGQKAVDDLNTESSNYSASLVTDPSALETVINLTAASVKERADAGLIPQQKAAEFQSQLSSHYAKSAIEGWITNGASQKALSDLKSGAYDQYLNGDQKFEMIARTEQGVRAEQAERQRQEAAERDAMTKAQEATQNAFLARLNSSENPLTAQDILKSNLDPFGSGSKEQFLKLLETNATRKIRTDANTYLDVWDRIHLPEGDPKRITDPNYLNSLVGKGLTVQDIQTFRNEMDGTKTQDGQIEAELKKNFLDSMKARLVKANPTLGLADPDGQTHYQAFLASFLPAYEKARSQGKSPFALLNPKSPDYMGDMAESFYRTPQQIVESMYRPQGAGSPGGSATAPSPAPSATPPPGLSRAQFMDWWAQHSPAAKPTSENPEKQQ